MPVSYLFNSGFAIRFLVRIWIIRFIRGSRLGQCFENTIRTVGHVDRVITAFEHEDNFAVTVFLRQSDHFLREIQIPLEDKPSVVMGSFQCASKPTEMKSICGLKDSTKGL